MTQTKTLRPGRTYTDEFKNQLVQLYSKGKRRYDIIREYSITFALLDKWIKQSNTTGSFKEKDNLSEEELQLIELRKADFRTKINVIKNNIHKYSVSAMCKVLHIPRSTYYYESKPMKDETQLMTNIIDILRRSQNNYRITILSQRTVYPFDVLYTRKIK